MESGRKQKLRMKGEKKHKIGGVKIMKETQKGAVIIIRRKETKHRREGETKN
jgi:hypothetical protein